MCGCRVRGAGSGECGGGSRYRYGGATVRPMPVGMHAAYVGARAHGVD